MRDDDEALRTFAGRQYNTEITDEAIIGMLCEKEVMEDEQAEQKVRDAERMTREKKDEEAKRAKIKAELLAEIEAEKAEEAKKTAAKTNKK